MSILNRQQRIYWWLLRLGVTSLITGFASATMPQAMAQATEDEKDKALIELRLAVLMKASVTTLVFTLKNNSDHEIKTVPVGVNQSQVIVEKPDGQETALVNYVTVLKFGVVQPGQSEVHKVDIADWFNSFGIKELGLYRTYWKFIHRKDDKTKVEYKSNDVYLLIEDKAQQEKAKK